MHLTFDDGPDPVSTPRLLEILTAHHTHATFFCSGSAVRTYPDIARRIAEEGHAIGNHGDSHRGFLFRPEEFIRSEIHAADLAISSSTGKTPNLLRPPYGAFGARTVRIARESGKRVVLWSYDARDFASANATRLSANIRNHVRPGAIILLHDTPATMPLFEAYLPSLLNDLAVRGIPCLPVTV